MTDMVDSATRSKMMSKIGARNTKPEITIRSLLHRSGFRFRLHVADLPGKPDIVLPRYRAAIFVHGCFWHGHDCYRFKWPATNAEFWREKITKNQKNDVQNQTKLTEKGWRVGIIRECILRGKYKNIGKTAYCLESWLKSDVPFIEVKP